MDILFPWRKSQGPGPGPGMNPNNSMYDSATSGPHHSLPHPAEHGQYYNNGGGGAPMNNMPSQPNNGRGGMMASMQSNDSAREFLMGQSQRSLGEQSRAFLMDGSEMGSTGVSFANTTGGGGEGGAPSIAPSMSSRGYDPADNSNRTGDNTTNQMMGIENNGSDYYEYAEDLKGGDHGHHQDDYYEDDAAAPSASGGPKLRRPLDESNRSNTSEISDGFSRVGGGRPPLAQSQQSHGGDGGYYQQSMASLMPEQNGGGSGEFYDASSGGGGGGGMPEAKPDRRAMMASFKGSNSNSSHNQSSYKQSSRSGFGDEYFDEEEEDLPVSPLRQLLDAINMSILPTSLRLSSLAQAVEFFDHRDRAMHDAELREGGAFVLYHKLGLVLRLSRCGEATIEASTKSTKKAGVGNGPTNHYLSYQQTLANSLAVQQQTEFDKEIAMICSCLEMVHRANPDAIAQTWDECGTEVIPLLVRVLERPFQKIERAVWMAIQEKANVPGSLERAVATAVTRDQKLAVQKVTKVLAMYSLVPEAKKPLCDCEGMLRWLTRIIDTHNYNRVKPGAPAIGGSAMGSTRLTGGLSSIDDNDSEHVKQTKRLELATRATSGSGLYMTEAARFNTIATLTNLAALENNRMSMLHETGLLDNICRAVHNERSDVPKQCSALAIMNLSNGDMDHVPEMARNDLVLETLLKLCKEDNPETRRNAVVTIFNIACSDQNTVRLARYRDGIILEALVELVGSDDPVLRTHDEARANAAETIFNMSCSEISETTDRMANHAGLLECLAVTLRGEHTGLEVKMYCSATLRRMAELIRHPMIAQGALLSALVKAATWTSTDCIAEAFRAQAFVQENCIIMAHHHGLLNALSRLALTRGEGPDVEKVRMASCLAIELMSRNDEARALLSQNEGIIMALTKASYGESERSGDVNMRMSGVSGLEGSVTGTYMDASGRSGPTVDDDDYETEDDDASLQSRRIQVALKNLVAAM